MNIRTALCRLLLCLIGLPPICILLYKAAASANVPGSLPASPYARLSQGASIRARQPLPLISLADGRDLFSEYTGDEAARRGLEQTGSPRALAAADFDEDGSSDVISAYATGAYATGAYATGAYATGAYATGAGGIITLNRGNPHARLPQRGEPAQPDDSPLLSPAFVFAAPQTPDLIGAGDFDADGHQDLLIAARGSQALDLLPGDGHGGFRAAQRIELPGAISALVTGDVNRRDGLADFVVSVTSAAGAQALIFEDAKGAARANPVAVALPSAASALALGEADDDSLIDIAVASGSEVIMIYGHGRDAAVEPSPALPRTSRRHFDAGVRSLAFGNFNNTAQRSLAVATDDGSIHLLTPSTRAHRANQPLTRWQDETLECGLTAGNVQLVSARASCAATDSLVALDAGGRQLRIISNDIYARRPAEAGDAPMPRAVVAFDADDEPVAALPVRLNPSALDDLIILRKHQTPPVVFTPQAMITFVVDNPAESGLGSLRDAIDTTNTNPGLDQINFALAAGTTINLINALPAITDPVIINGFSAPGAGNKPGIELNGAAISAGNGLTINAGNTTVLGMVINRFGLNGIVVASNNNGLTRNFIGTDLSGTTALGNRLAGVLVTNAGNQIGKGSGGGNVLSGNGQGGVRITGGNATANQVQGNFVGTNSTGTAAIPNSGDGILISNASGNLIGGAAAGAGNIICGNDVQGVTLSGDATTGNQVQGNFIGVTASGLALGNGSNGISIANLAKSNSIGGLAAGAGNTIAFNGSNGISVVTSAGNAILSNSIFSNTQLGIDLNGDGVTANDAGDADTGANNSQNFPQLTSLASSVGSTIISGTLNSAPNTTYTVQFFTNFDCNPSGFGEGQQLLATRNVTTDAGGNASFSFSFSGNAAPPITATATDPAGNTSEFSACLLNASGADLAIKKAASASVVKPGDTVTYTITATNRGPSLATGVTLLDTLPNSVTFISCSTSTGGQCLGTGNARQINFGAIVAGASAIATITAKVNDTVTTGTVIRNTATISSSISDDFLANNTAIVDILVNADAPALICPANVTVNLNADASAKQCSATVPYPPPTVRGLPGVSVVCLPPSGATFPVGTTAVDCTARDEAGVRAACGFSITVNTPPALKVTLENGGTALDFGPADVQRKSKKKTPKGCDCTRSFTIENTGCSAVNLFFGPPARTGSDVTSGRITNPDDVPIFPVTIVNADGTEQPAFCGVECSINIPAGVRRTFRVRFLPLLPAYAGKTSGLDAINVIPDVITSHLTFGGDGTMNVINLIGHVTTEVHLLNPANARGAKQATFAKSGDELTVEFGIFDADLDVNDATYEFLDANGNVIGQAIDVDLTDVIRQKGIVKGQSFVVTQKFTGASSNPGIKAVRLTIKDARSSDTVTALLGATGASAVSAQADRERIRLMLPVRRLNGRP